MEFFVLSFERSYRVSGNIGEERMNYSEEIQGGGVLLVSEVDFIDR